MATEVDTLLRTAVSLFTSHRALFPQNDELDSLVDVYMGQDNQDSQEADEADGHSPLTTPETAASVPEHEHEVETEIENELKIETSLDPSPTRVPRHNSLLDPWKGRTPFLILDPQFPTVGQDEDIAEDTRRLDLDEERAAFEGLTRTLSLGGTQERCTCGPGCLYARSVPVLRGHHDFTRWEEDLFEAARRVNAIDLLTDGSVRPEMQPPEAGCSNYTYNRWVEARLRFEKRNKSLLAGIKRTVPCHLESFLSGIDYASEAYAKVRLFCGHGPMIINLYAQASRVENRSVVEYNKLFKAFNQTLSENSAGTGSPYTPELVKYLYLEHFDESSFLSRCKGAMYELFQIASTGNGHSITLDEMMGLAEDTERVEVDWVLRMLDTHLQAPARPGPSVQQFQQPAVVNGANPPHPAQVRRLDPRAPSFESAPASPITPAVSHTPEPVELRPMPPENRLRSNGGGRYVVPQRRH